MKSPKTPEQLADAIESLVASYVDDMRRTVQEAVERSFSKRGPTTRSSRGGHGRDTADAGRPAKRRTTEELGELSEKLYDLVCARPGEAMTIFAEQIGLPLISLHRPMSKLKAEGRVRSVGERNLTRYFPVVGRRSKNADA